MGWGGVIVFFQGVKLSSPGPSPKGEQTNTGKYAGLVRFVCSHKAGISKYLCVPCDGDFVCIHRLNKYKCQDCTAVRRQQNKK